MSDNKKTVTDMIEKAGKTANATDALKFSQAALNAANAMCSLRIAEQTPPPI